MIFALVKGIFERIFRFFVGHNLLMIIDNLHMLKNF